MRDVRSYYNRIALTEWERLDRHRTEFALTMRAFREYLPSPQARLLDIGGGPGRYAIALATQGYDVTLFDLSRECLKLAREKAAEAGVSVSFECGDAVDLACFEPQSFDAVLLMGPLYHLIKKEDRLACIREVKRVLRARAVLFASFITRYAPIRDAAKNAPEWILEREEELSAILQTGVFDGSGEEFASGGEFTTSYFATSSEVRPLLEGEGFETLDVIACEGVISGIEEKVNQLSGEVWEAWVDLNYRLGRDPSIQGSAEHLLWVGELKA